MLKKTLSALFLLILLSLSFNATVFAHEDDESGNAASTSVEDEDEDDMEDAVDKIEAAEKEIAKAEEVILEKEAEGKDVSNAIIRLDGAKGLLSLAQAAFDDGNYEEAEEFAREAKHEAMYAKGKDIISKSDESQLGQTFGQCIAEAAQHSEDKFAAFDDCFEEFKAAVAEFVEGLLSQEDLESNQSFDERIAELAAQQDETVKDLLLNLAAFNMSGINEEELLSEIEEILNSDEDLDEKIEELTELIEKVKEDSRRQKFFAGVIPFKDTDDEDWYFNFVEQMEAEACISGFKDEAGNELGEFRPGKQVLFGESVKFVLQCILDEDPEETDADTFWAQGYALKLKNEFSDLLSEELLIRVERALVDEAEFNTPVTRGELIQMIVDVLDLDVKKANRGPFNDVGLTHTNVDAINHALLAGVISGDEATGTFRPNEIPNRAEVAKIIILAKQLF